MMDKVINQMDEVKKMYWTVPDMFGTFSAIITISGFESEEDAQKYLEERAMMNNEVKNAGDVESNVFKLNGKTQNA